MFSIWLNSHLSKDYIGTRVSHVTRQFLQKKCEGTLCFNTLIHTSFTNSKWNMDEIFGLKGVSSKPSGKYILGPDFWFLVKDLKSWLHAYFSILLSCAKFQ